MSFYKPNILAVKQDCKTDIIGINTHPPPQKKKKNRGKKT